MGIIEGNVFHTHPGKDLRQVRFPDALREPESFRLSLEVLAEVDIEHVNLPTDIALGYRGHMGS